MGAQIATLGQYRASFGSKEKEGLSPTLNTNEIWDTFFTKDDSPIFDTKAAKNAFTCRTDKDVQHVTLKKCNRVAAICIGVGADGVVESVY